MVVLGIGDEAIEKEPTLSSYSAIEWGAHPEIITALVEAGADPNARTSIFRVGKTPLTRAIKSNAHPEIIDTLDQGGRRSDETGLVTGVEPGHIVHRGPGNHRICRRLIARRLSLFDLARATDPPGQATRPVVHQDTPALEQVASRHLMPAPPYCPSTW